MKNKILILYFAIIVISKNIVLSQNIAKIDYLEVDKSDRILKAFYQGKLVKKYKIALGAQPIGHKHIEGDMKTPEGTYTIESKNPNSNYHKNLGISYPNQADIKYAKKIGKSAGGLIKIHGLPKGWGNIGKYHYLKDWTWGCIAVNNNEIDELYAAIKIGSKIKITP